MISCNSNIIRTFPKDLQKEVTVEICEETLLIDFEEKVSLHTDSMRLLTKSCYEKILEANCTQYLALAYGDLSCYSLKKESDMVYRKAKEKKKDNIFFRIVDSFSDNNLKSVKNELKSEFFEQPILQYKFVY